MAPFTAIMLLALLSATPASQSFGPQVATVITVNGSTSGASILLGVGPSRALSECHTGRRLGETHQHGDDDSAENDDDGHADDGGHDHGSEASHVAASEASAYTLLVVVAFVMMLFYLVNWNDQDVRRYAWQTIASTMSIFTAVLMFSGIDSAFFHFLEEWGVLSNNTVVSANVERMVYQYLEFVLIVCFLQFVLGFCSGGILEGDHGHELVEKWSWVIRDVVRHDYDRVVEERLVRSSDRGVHVSVALIEGVEVPVILKRKELFRRHRAMKCWGMILGHMAAFADLRAGHRMMSLDVFSTPYLCVLVVIINCLMVWLLYAVFDHFRERRRKRLAAAGRPTRRLHMFDEEAEETENEVVSLSSSYLMTQAFIFWITGRLPFPSEHDEEHYIHKCGFPNPTETTWLYAVALMGCVLTLICTQALSHEQAQVERCRASAGHQPVDHADVGRRGTRESLRGATRASLTETEAETFVEPSDGDEHMEGFQIHHFLERMAEVFMMSSAMVTAWSLREATQYSLSRLDRFKGSSFEFPFMGGKLVHAISLSFGAAIFVLLLDCIDDAWKAHQRKRNLIPSGNDLVMAIINAIAILVGLTWEECFDAAVVETTKVVQAEEGVRRSYMAELLSAVVVAIVVVPAWRRYILHRSLQLEMYAKEQLNADKQILRAEMRANARRRSHAATVEVPVPGTEMTRVSTGSLSEEAQGVSRVALIGEGD